MEEFFFQTAAGILLAIITSYITVQLSIRKFRSERMWERKIEAYSKLIESLHFLFRSIYKYIELAEEDQHYEFNDEVSIDIDNLLAEGRKEINKSIDSGFFIFSDDFNEKLKKYKIEQESIENQFSYGTSKYECMLEEHKAIEYYIKELIYLAQKDLKK